MHVVTNTREYKGKTYKSDLLRRSYREGGKVKKETLGNISHLPDHVIEMIRGALKGETYLPVGSNFEIRRSLPHGHVAAVLGTLRKIGLDKIIASKDSRTRNIVIAMIVERIIEPASKLATARALRESTALSTLGEVLGVSGADEDDLYEAMDWLEARQKRIETKLAKKHLENGSLVLYDVTSSYYTGSHCPLARFGHTGKGKKKGFPQIKYGLLCNAEGCPVAVEVFEGNVGDPATLASQIRKIRKRFDLKRVVMVGDRGTITEARIEGELRPIDGLDWIGALRAPAIRKLAEEGIVQPSLFDEQDLAEVTSPEYPGERLIACKNPYLAEDRARTREELLAATEEELDKIVAATQREKRRLKGKDQIGLRVGRNINSHKVGKHFKITITDDSFSYERDTEKINSEAALDGIYIIRTSVPEEELSAVDTVRSYKNLSVVERAFRCLKSVDLKVEPIGHRKPERVRAHIFICMLAYYVEWHMRASLAPILFDDEEKELAWALRESVVAPSVRSPGAKAKDRKKRTPDGYPVHSFQTLLRDLATITMNRVSAGSFSLSSSEAEFSMITTPTKLQMKAFGLLGVPLSL